MPIVPGGQDAPGGAAEGIAAGVAGVAAACIEQGAEAVLGFEDSLEHFLSGKKLGLLFGGQISQWFSKSRLLRCLATPKKESQQHRANDSFRIHRLFLSNDRNLLSRLNAT